MLLNDDLWKTLKIWVGTMFQKYISLQENSMLILAKWSISRWIREYCLGTKWHLKSCFLLFMLATKPCSLGAHTTLSCERGPGRQVWIPFLFDYMPFALLLHHTISQWLCPIIPTFIDGSPILIPNHLICFGLDNPIDRSTGFVSSISQPTPATLRSTLWRWIKACKVVPIVISIVRV